ncbi:MAG: hypothetical protein ABIP54_01955 [Candidatus Andersenbacteria bacterium]
MNSDQKLDLFKEAIARVYAVSDNWLIYIRGSKGPDAIAYMKTLFKDFDSRCKVFDALHENNWAKSTRIMLKYSNYDYVYVFLEDHFLTSSIDVFTQTINEAIQEKIDFFTYSFFNIGVSNVTIGHLYPKNGNLLHSFILQKDTVTLLRKTNSGFYPLSLAGVVKKDFFIKILKIEDAFLLYVPWIVQVCMEQFFFAYPKNRKFWSQVNRLAIKLGIRFVIYPPATPFNLERSLYDIEESLLPTSIGVLKSELFANWDDDNKLPNSSLIKQGLYPFKFTIDTSDDSDIRGEEIALHKNQNISRQYYPDMHRITNLPIVHIKVISGSVQITAGEEHIALQKGESICGASNIPHTIEALEEARIMYTIDPKI